MLVRFAKKDRAGRPLRRVGGLLPIMHWLKMAVVMIVFVSGGMYGHAQNGPSYNSPSHRFEQAIREHDEAKNIGKYSLNLMWINKTLDLTQKFINPARDEHDLVQNLIEPVLKWAEANPSAHICLWFDSKLTPDAAVQATAHILHIQMSARQIKNIDLCDIRKIKIVSQNPDCFSDQVPIYFRIDMLKVIIIVDSIVQEHMDAAIFSDMEVGDLRPQKTRMTKAELFNSNSMQLLKKQGLLLNAGSSGSLLENQFLQLIKDDRMINAIKCAIVNVNLLRAVNALNSRDPSQIEALDRSVFLSTRDDVYLYYYGTAPGEQIKVNSYILFNGEKSSPWINYDPVAHGYSPFGLYLNHRGDAFQPDPHHKGALVPRRDLLKFSIHVQDAQAACVGREVQVRSGRDHITKFKGVVRPPSSGDEFSCVLWK